MHTWTSCTVDTSKLLTYKVNRFYLHVIAQCFSNILTFSALLFKHSNMMCILSIVITFLSLVCLLQKHCMCLISVCVHSMLVASLPCVPNTSFPCGVPGQCHNRPANPHFLILVCLRSIHRERIMALFLSRWTRVSVSRFLPGFVQVLNSRSALFLHCVCMCVLVLLGVSSCPPSERSSVWSVVCSL